MHSKRNSAKARQTKRPTEWVIAAVAAMSLMAPPVQAAVLTVTNLNNSGAGSLRQAIAIAAPGDTINFSVNGAIVLTTGELLINKNLTIAGPGPGNLAISGNENSRVFNVSAAVTAAIDGVTIRDGYILPGSGGGVVNNGTLTLSECVVHSNEAHAAVGGGGVFNAFQLTVSGCLFSENLSHFGVAGGGGILNNGTLTVSGSEFSMNSVESGAGAAIYNSSTLSMSNTSLHQNISDGSGGGIQNVASGTVTLSGSTFVHNHSHDHGGGINNDGTLTMFNSTLSENHGHHGGGMVNYGWATISATTFSSNNSEDIEGASIHNHGTLNIKDSILANGNTSECWTLAGWTTAGVNFDTDGTCQGFTQVTPLQLKLGLFANNGGPTWTIPLQAGSVAINAALSCSDFFGVPITTDQRGVLRPQGSACDVGAYERAIDSAP